MTDEDVRELARIQAGVPAELTTCQGFVDKLELKMQLVDVEHIFGGERIVVYYLAESRVDFRELVRLLAGEFQTRIEMRQIGVRDEAKLLADYGDCGCPVCCNTHLVEMPPVSMRMAKLQKATLDPTKISGRCGRLKCCLRYEFDTYEQMQKDLPPIGSEVDTPEGQAKVVGHEILAGQVLVDHGRPSADAGRRGRTPRSQAAPRRQAGRPKTPNRSRILDSHARPFPSHRRTAPRGPPLRVRGLCFRLRGAGLRAERAGAWAPRATSEPMAATTGRGRKKTKPERHVTGQELCEAIRQLRPGAVRLHGQDGARTVGASTARAISARSSST